MHYIFRKNDRVWLYAALTSVQFENELAACLTNEGGTLGDYVVVTNDDRMIPPGMVPRLQDDNTVAHIVSPVKIARDRARVSLTAKLKTAGLNLNDDELGLLTRG
jgi:hypothetical protein